MYEGTNLTLHCSVQFPVFIDYHWSVNIKKDDNTVVNSTSISVHSNNYGVDVEFSVLNSDTDSGNYTCVVDNIYSNDKYSANMEESSPSLTLLILGIVILSSIYNIIICIDLPVPSIDLQVIGSGETGTDVVLTCQIETVPRLVVTPVVYWFQRHHINIINKNITSLSNTTTSNNITYSMLSIEYLQTSDAGIYFCETKISIDVLSKNIVQKGNVTLFIERKLCVLDLMT